MTRHPIATGRRFAALAGVLAVSSACAAAAPAQGSATTTTPKTDLSSWFRPEVEDEVLVWSGRPPIPATPPTATERGRWPK